MDRARRRQFTFSGTYILLVLLGLYLMQGLLPREAAPRQVPYSDLTGMVRTGKVARADVRATEIIAELKPTAEGAAPERVVAQRLPGVEPTALLGDMESKGVVVSGRIEKTSWWDSLLLGWMLPFGIMFGLYMLVMRRLARGGGPLTVGRNRAKIFDASAQGRVTFDDVAGVDEAEAELVEVVDFLKNPSRYVALGARIPRGVLLVGPPGTGKTLLARAVAGEAGVPFFSLSGSSFVEMFVGVGAARMRDLFEQAKQRAPCIVFIDELDAIGKSRGGLGAIATHDEREQTLNQLLVEMDGFDPTVGVIIMAATNRPEVLDLALLRAGRFDRQVLVDRPDLRGREEILRVHTRGVRTAPGVQLRVIARRSPGMVGADLANVVNEAALAAARRHSDTVAEVDFEEALDRIQLGLKKQGRVMGQEEKQRVAYHEGGHALVAMSLRHADPVHRVTIIPRSIGALGATLQLPSEERFLMTEEELSDRLCVMLGGRAAELLACGGLSTGSENDLERATETARQMVCRFGMSARLGPVTLGRPAHLRFIDESLPFGERQPFSERTAEAIDREIRALVDAQHERATFILRTRREALERIALSLLGSETIERPELERLISGEAGAAAAEGPDGQERGGQQPVLPPA